MRTRVRTFLPRRWPSSAEFFGGVCVDLGAEEAIAQARTFAPDLIIVESADYLGRFAAAVLDVPVVTHGVGIAIEEQLAHAMDAAAGARLSSLELTLPEPRASVDPWPECLQRDTWQPPVGRIAIRSEAHESEPHASEAHEGEDGSEGSKPAFPGPGRQHLPRVLVTLGTVLDEPELLATIVDSLAGPEVNVVVAVNPSARADTAPTERTGVRVVGFVPMRRLLEGVDVVVASGGAGTVLAVLGSGIPMVLLPMGLDKPLNAERASAVGAAMVVDSPDQIGKAVTKVLSDESFAHSASTVAQEIADMNSAETVLTLLLDHVS
ncbi:glycosyltransferase [Streptomyces sp. DG2A-72]|uniref:glycosyltransferase n=1 Tax=Streptomyces sp. DG2A-72 TaxID=3051386 RepID=UPI00265BBA41|nr:nucleotide disphospho-sugar-binding domain-containing protein [Streptomyces sp. DG2A-72]MDO0939160.1 glycosyltransferase [Streptomyces sp. DG2A-72]